MSWSNSPALRVAFVILLCSAAGAAGLYVKMGPQAQNRAEFAAGYGLFIAGGSLGLLALFLGIRKLGRLTGPQRQEDTP